jgi:hypothetical protein
MLGRIFGKQEKKVKPQRPRVFEFTDFRIRYRVNGDVVVMYDNVFEPVKEQKRGIQQTYMSRTHLDLYGYDAEFSVEVDADRMFMFKWREENLIRDGTHKLISLTMVFPTPTKNLSDLDQWTEFSRRLKTKLAEGYWFSFLVPAGIVLNAASLRDPDNPEESVYAVNSRAPELLDRAERVLAVLHAV